MRQLLAAIVIGSVCSVGLLASSLTLTAKIDKQTVALYQPVTYEVSISGEDTAGLPALRLPDFGSAFRVVSRSQMNSISLINGKMSSVLTRQFTLVPQQVGAFTLAPSTIEKEGQVFSTNAISIQVTSPNAATQSSMAPQQVQRAPRVQQPAPVAASPLFLESTLDRHRIYAGQSVTYTLTMFRRVQLWDNVRMELAELPNAYVVTLPKAQEKVVQKNGIRYYAAELVKQQITPLQEGVFHVPSTKVGVLTDPFKGQQVLLSPVVTVNVKPLPEANRPEGFSGLVGQFSMSMTRQSEGQVTQNQPISVVLTVEGNGVLDRLDELSVQADERFRVYKAGVQDQQTSESFRREFDYVVIPKVPGTFSFPRFTLHSFNPQLNRYESITTDEFELTVRNDPNATESEDVVVQVITPERDELRYLKTSWTPTSPPSLLSSWLFWLLLLINGAALMHMAWQAVYSRQVVSTSHRLKQIHKALLALKKKEAHGHEDLTTAYQWLLDALSVKWGLSFQPLSQSEIRDVLTQKGVSKKAIDAVTQCMEALSFSAYAPSAQYTSAEAPIQKAIDIVAYLEKWEGQG